MENCKEFYLEDIVSVSVHPAKGCQFPIPFSVHGIMSMSNCVLSAPVFTIGLEEGMLTPVDGSMSAKCTSSVEPSGVVSAIEIGASLAEDSDLIRRSLISMLYDDYYVCVRKHDGQIYLAYTLPGSFNYQPSTENTQTNSSRKVAFGLKSNSEFIPITLK